MARGPPEVVEADDRARRASSARSMILTILWRRLVFRQRGPPNTVEVLGEGRTPGVRRPVRGPATTAVAGDDLVPAMPKSMAAVGDELCRPPRRWPGYRTAARSARGAVSLPAVPWMAFQALPPPPPSSARGVRGPPRISSGVMVAFSGEPIGRQPRRAEEPGR